MPALLRDRLVLVWILLVAVTLLSATIGGAHGMARPGHGGLVTAAVLTIAFGKAAMVMFTYMDISHAPRVLKALCCAWLTIALCALLAVYGGAFA